MNKQQKLFTIYSQLFSENYLTEYFIYAIMNYP